MSLCQNLFVYGLFVGSKCVYIGHTWTKRERKYAHSRRFPNAEFRVLRHCVNWDGLVVERALVKEYLDAGHPLANVNHIPGRPRKAKQEAQANRA